MKNKCLLVLSALAVLTAACDIDNAEHPEFDELGAVVSSFDVGYASGAVEIQVYANKPGTAAFETPLDWAVIRNPNFDADTVITVDYTENRSGAERTAAILLSTKSRSDTVYIRQNYKQ